MKTLKQIDQDIARVVKEASEIKPREQGAKRKISALNAKVVFYKKCKEAISSIENMGDDYVKKALTDAIKIMLDFKI